MNTKRAISGIGILGALIAVSMWISTVTGRFMFTVIAGVCSVLVIGLLYYAVYREREHGDRSGEIFRKSAVAVLVAVGLWVAFVFGRLVFD
jgi:uncharacterized membrane-anchored protein